MLRVMGLGLIITLSVFVASAGAGEWKEKIKLRTIAGEEAWGKLTCNYGHLVEITDREGQIHRFRTDSIETVWREKNLALELCAAGTLCGYIFGRSSEKDEDQGRTLYHFETSIIGGGIGAILGYGVRIWVKSDVDAFPLVYCPSAQNDGNPGLKLVFAFRF